MARYAQATQVSSDKSKQEIERTLQRYGATHFMYGWEPGYALLGFEMRDRRVRFELPMPDANEKEFTHTATGIRRSAKSQQDAYEQATRQRWRALALVVKAKLEAVDSGITSFEEEFLSNFVLPDNSTVGDHAVTAVAQMYASGKMLPMFPQYRALTDGVIDA